MKNNMRTSTLLFWFSLVTAVLTGIGETCIKSSPAWFCTAFMSLMFLIAGWYVRSNNET